MARILQQWSSNLELHYYKAGGFKIEGPSIRSMFFFSSICHAHNSTEPLTRLLKWNPQLQFEIF